MKTAMQELIEFIDFIIKETKDISNDGIYQLVVVKEMAKRKLEKEKEQIQKAFSDGQEMPINHPTLPHYSREEYYNDNYNQNK